MLRKLLLLALLFVLMIASCECDKAKEQVDEIVQGEEAVEERTMEQHFEEQFAHITLTEENIQEAIDKLPAWVEITARFSEEIDALEDVDMTDGLSFINRVPGLKDALEAEGIDVENFFPMLEKILHGHSVVYYRRELEENKEQFEMQKQMIQAQIDDPNVPEDQKAQFRSMLAEFESQMKMLEDGPPGFTEEELDLIEANADKISAVMQKLQEDAQRRAVEQAQQLPE